MISGGNRCRRYGDAAVATGTLSFHYAASPPHFNVTTPTTGMLAEGYSAADLRHGPVAVVAAGAPVLILDAGGAASADLRDLGTLARGREAPVAVCAPRPEADLPVPGEVPEALSAITITVQAQHVALALARARGVDPDAPQGLSKVTRTQ